MNLGGDCPRFLDLPHDLRQLSPTPAPTISLQALMQPASKASCPTGSSITTRSRVDSFGTWSDPMNSVGTRWELGGWWSFGYDELLISRVEKNVWIFYIILHSLHLSFLEKRCNYISVSKGSWSMFDIWNVSNRWAIEIMEFNLQKRLLLPKLRADNYPPEPPLIIAM